MAKLINDEKNIAIEWNLTDNEMVDVDLYRDSYENWSPCEVILNIDGQEKINLAGSSTLTLEELRRFLDESKKIISKDAGVALMVPVECYFELKAELIDEDDIVEIEWWFNKGVLSDGAVYGYHEGYRFYVNKNDFKTFIECLVSELNYLINAV